MNDLPRILVIDDQYGTNAFLRGQFCETCDIVEIGRGSVVAEPLPRHHTKIAYARFCAAQAEEGARVENSIEEAESTVASGWPSHNGWRWSLVLLDLRFDAKPGNPEDEYFGLRILERLVERWPAADKPGVCEIPIVVLSSIERTRYGAGAGRAGASDYVEKSDLNREKMCELLDRHGLIEDSTGRLWGRSLALLKTLREARQVARHATGNRLILGEQSTGKTELAQYIHEMSPRKSGPYVPFTVSFGMEPHLLKTQLFGFWRGAYTGANESEAGLAERAHHGVLFIDEIANLPVASLREFLEYGRPVGGRRRLERLGTYPSSPPRAVERARASLVGDLDPDTKAIFVDSFLLTATNQPIDDESYRREKEFPDDLFVRLGQEFGAPIRFPNLRSRKEDIENLFMRFLEQESKSIGGVWPKSAEPEVLQALASHSWPGNLGELRGYARRVANDTWPWDEVLLKRLPALNSPASSPRLPTKAATEVAQPASDAVDLKYVIRILKSALVRDSRNELEGALKKVGNAYGGFLERLLSVSLQQTREISSRQKDETLGDLSPTKAMSLLFGEQLRTDKAADEIKRLALLLPEAPSPDSDIGRVLSWAINLRKGGRRTSSAAEQ